MPIAVPSLDEIAARPESAGDLPIEVVSALLARCAAVQLALAAKIGRTPITEPQIHETRLLTVEQAADKLAVTPEWLYRRGKRLGLAVKLDNGTLRFSSAALETYIRQNTAGASSGRRRRSAALSV